MPWIPSSSDSFLPLQRKFYSLVSGLSEWEQIITNRTLPYPQRVQQIAQSIDFHSEKSLDDQLDQATREKGKSLINDQIYTVLHKLTLYQKLIEQINQIRMTKVTDTDEEHLRLFDLIWSRLVLQSDDDREERKMISKRWTEIGFQGSNPLTDFRGMGLLGLQAIEYLSRDRAKCLTYVNIPSPNDYSFAIGVINVISWLVHLLEYDSTGKRSHPLLSHFAVYPCNIEEFFRLFLLVFEEWNQYWLDEKATIMQFEQLSKVFRAELLRQCEQYRPIRSNFRLKNS